MYNPFLLGIWLGGSDVAQEGKFIWDSDGGVVSAGYTNWAPTQPDDAGGNEDCIHIYPQASFNQPYWNDWPCSQLNPFVCELQP